MNQYDPYSDPRFDDNLNEHDARSRQYARRRAAEARSQSRSSQEGPYASGRRAPTSRYSTRQPRNHFDAREEFARIDEEARERDMRRIARQHGIAPRSVGERPSDPYERAAVEHLPARRLRERAEEHDHTNDYHSERYRDQSRARVEDIEDPALLEQIHHSGDHPHTRRRAQESGGMLASVVGSLPFFGNRSENDELDEFDGPRRSAGSARTRNASARPRASRRTDSERDYARQERPARRPSASGRPRPERTERFDGGSHSYREGRGRDYYYLDDAHAERGEGRTRRASGEARRPHRVGAERTQAQWRSRNDRPRTERRPRERSRGYSSRNQVDMSPIGGGILPSGGFSGIPFALIVRVVIALAIIALVVFAGMNISRAIAGAQTITVTVDGSQQDIRGSKDLNALLASGISSQPGDLLAVDGSLITEGGGYPITAIVDGEMITDYSKKLDDGANIKLSRGADIVEPSRTEERTTDPEPEEKGTGPVHRVSQEGSQGRERVIVGEISGTTIVDKVLEEGSPRTYAKQYVDTGGKKVIALTFDDGPLPEYTNQILDILRDNEAKGTFFTLGTRIDEEGGADCIKRAASEGHQLCTHTFDHAAGSGQGVNLSYMSPEEQREEIQKGQEAISNVTGQEASKVFRSPGGNFPLEVWRNVEDLVSSEIGWNIDTTDWKKPGAAAIEEALLSASPGDIILMHDGGGDRQQTVDALRSALPQLKEDDFSFVTIDELLQYSLVDEQKKDESSSEA